MSDRDWDENDLSDEELLRMWEEGELVPILHTHVEIEPPHMHQPDSATRGAGVARSENLRLGSSVTTDLAVRETLNTEAAA